LSFPKGVLANFLHIAEMVEECGPALGLPYTKALGNGLFEIRAKGCRRHWSVILLYS
ncbi:MAG: type II toxin-antitoxin system RelE/ParE family toxin, partial [Methylococcales bacterium]|nr:type II toxin-antitoxin system RelE/ParE family toxin [Methylococcales bacterium]